MTIVDRCLQKLRSFLQIERWPQKWKSVLQKWMGKKPPEDRELQAKINELKRDGFTVDEVYQLINTAQRNGLMRQEEDLLLKVLSQQRWFPSKAAKQAANNWKRLLLRLKGGVPPANFDFWRLAAEYGKAEKALQSWASSKQRKAGAGPCAAKLSHALKASKLVTAFPGCTVDADDNKRSMGLAVNAAELGRFLRERWGKGESFDYRDLINQHRSGILHFGVTFSLTNDDKDRIFKDASGHITLWHAGKCLDGTRYYESFPSKEIAFWDLRPWWYKAKEQKANGAPQPRRSPRQNGARTRSRSGG